MPLPSSPSVSSSPPAGAFRARSPAILVRTVASPAELRSHLRIREAVFVNEQALFAGTDRDIHDDDPATLHVLALCDGVAAGTVRLYPLDPAGLTWQGDRLAVLVPFRTQSVGKPLVRFAVRTAAQRGGRVMHAHVQLANVRFFQRLGWTLLGEPEDYCGIPHQGMEIDLHAHPQG